MNPIDLRPILLAALEKLPADRIPTAEELAGAIAEAQSQVPAPDPDLEAQPADEAAWDQAGLQGQRLLYEPLQEPVAPPAAAPDNSPLLFRWALVTAALLGLLFFVQGFWRMEEPSPAPPREAAAPHPIATPVEKPASVPRTAVPPSVSEMLVDDSSPAEEEPAPAPAPYPPAPVERWEEIAQVTPEIPVQEVPPPSPEPAPAVVSRPRQQPAAPRPSPEPALARRVSQPWEEGTQPQGLLKPGPGVEEPVPLGFPRFAYPADARGVGPVDVRLALLVDERGRVLDARVREGAPPALGFEETALAVARKISFQPATRYDVPGKMWTEVILEFVE